MSSAAPRRTIDTAIARGLLQQLVEQNSVLFGFSSKEDVQAHLELPESIPLKFKFRKEQEAKLITHHETTA